jgi:hypothetical protein
MVEQVLSPCSCANSARNGAGLIGDIHDKYLSRETEFPLEAARGF